MISKFLLPLIFLFGISGWSQTSPTPAQGKPIISVPPKPKEPEGTKIQGMIINADDFLQDRENDMIELKGKVQIIYQNEHLSCDSATINLRSKIIDAKGDVLVVTQQADIGGTRILLDYEADTGIIYNGYVRSGTVLFEGDVIHKTSHTDFLANNAKYTTCTTCPEAWSFNGKSIRAELGGYAYIKNSLLNVGGIPVFWMPYLIVPLKSDRQTGLLTPEFESSDSGGLTISQSLFWAIDRSQDATLTLKNYELRGPKSLLNYRYVLSEHSAGELNTSLLADKAFADESRINSFRNSAEENDVINRWFLKYNHYYELPDDLVHRVQLNSASDLQYPKDFPLETLNHGDSAMENRISLTKNTEKQHFSVDSSYYVNLLQSNPLANNEDAVHRLPEFHYALAESKIADSPFLFSFDGYYTNFTRAGLSYDNLSAAYSATGPNDIHLAAGGASAKCLTSEWEKFDECKKYLDGTFDPGQDLIRSGQRVDLTPTIYYPIQFGPYLDILPKIAYRETFYAFDLPSNVNSTANKRQLRTDLSLKTYFNKVYGDLSDNSGSRIKHEVVPEVSFTSVPWLYQSKHPFFGSANPDDAFFSNQENISDADINSPYGLQFDYSDRTYNRKKVTLSIANKFTKKEWTDGYPQYLQFLFWKVSQSFDAYLAERNSEQPLSDILSDLIIKLDNLQVYQRANYFPYHYVTNTSTRVRLNNPGGEFVQVAHLLSYNITPSASVDKSTRTEDVTVSGKKIYRNVEFVGKFTYDLNPLNDSSRLKSFGYGAQVKLPGDCWYLNVIQYRPTGGDINSTINFSFVWDGQPKSTIPENILDPYGF